MSVIVLLIAVSLLVALGFLGAFIWSIRAGQYDDDYTPSVRMLFESGSKPENQNSKSKKDEYSKQ